MLKMYVTPPQTEIELETKQKYFNKNRRQTIEIRRNQLQV